ncbi:MAG: SCP2 sterol-binding domain-containing protein [Promethearchaeota archaeon]
MNVGRAMESLSKIIERLNQIHKAQAVFITNIAGKDVDWDMTFQFNLDNEEPFYLEIKERKGKIKPGTLEAAEIVLSGDPEALVRICEGKGDFTHAISREQINVEKGKVMDVIRLTRAITIVLKTK